MERGSRARRRRGKDRREVAIMDGSVSASVRALVLVLVLVRVRVPNKSCYEGKSK